MNRILSFVFLAIGLFVFSGLGYGQQAQYYYYGSKKITLSQSSTQVYARVAVQEKEAVKQLLQQNFAIDREDMVSLQHEGSLLIDLKTPNSNRVTSIVNSLKSSGKALLVRPALVAPDGKAQIIDEGFYVKLKPGTSYLQLSGLAAQYHCSVEKQYAYNSKTYILKAGAQNNYDAIAMANLFFESGLFEYAEPDFQVLNMLQSTPNDPLYNLQWAANNTGATNQYNGTVGADIDLDEAWDITQGNSAIRIAVIDEGVQRSHPDLINNIDPMGFGLVAANATTGDVLSTARSHGTSCAGIISAEANNNIGVAGVAPLCKIIPVNLTINTAGNFGSFTQLTQCIDWAWNNAGADVLSNSWGGGTPSSLVHDAIIRATSLGRGGKGALVIFASGNNDAGLSSPAIYKETIAVGAMSMCYQRKSGASCDGEYWWGSNYGTGLDITAPGVKIATTRVTGTGTAPNADYNLTFNGTSSATPFVSGVAALVLSINNNFTQAEVREILEKSARKVSGFTYTQVEYQPNGTWNAQMGHGLLNAKNAVLLAQNPSFCNVEITKPSSLQICSGNSLPLSISNHIAGNGYEWRKDDVVVGSGTVFNANQTGSYDVILTTASGCKDTSYKLSVVVAASEGALVARAGNDTSICANTKIFLGGGPAGIGGTPIVHPMRGLAYDLSNNFYTRFDLQQPSGAYKIIDSSMYSNPGSDRFYSGAAATPYGLYIIHRSENSLGRVDTATGAVHHIGKITTGTNPLFNALAYDPTTGKLFALCNISAVNKLYEINKLTGEGSFVANITGAVGSNYLASLSIDNTGQMYSVKLSATANNSAQLLSIDKATGVSTLVGNTGFLSTYAQTNDVDPISNELYHYCSVSPLTYNGNYSGKGLYLLNKTTGAATLIGSIAEPYNMYDALAIANKEYKYQWSPATYLSNANDAHPQFSPPGPGIYTYTLTITDLCGNTASDQVNITIVAAPIKPAISPANPVLSHQNSFSQTLSFTPEAGITYAWFKNNVDDGNGTNSYTIDFTHATGSTYFVKALSSSNGCVEYSDTLSFTYATGLSLNNNTAASTCDISFYDAGGPTGTTGTSSFTKTITPTIAGKKMRLSLYSLSLSGSASLTIYDGPAVTDPQLAVLTSANNSNALQQFTATNPTGVLTISISPNGSSSTGWLGGLTCADGGVVPVSLINWAAQWRSSKIQLNWLVENQINLARYQIERSIDGRQFAPIGTVAAQANGGRLQYAFMDENVPGAEVIYYRLKMLDTDGSHRYSSIIKMRRSTQSQTELLAAWPNPVKDILTMEFESKRLQTVQYMVLDAGGKQLLHGRAQVNTGIQQLYINVGHLPAGVYTLQLKGSDAVLSHKLIKE